MTREKKMYRGGKPPLFFDIIYQYEYLLKFVKERINKEQ